MIFSWQYSSAASLFAPPQYESSTPLTRKRRFSLLADVQTLKKRRNGTDKPRVSDISTDTLWLENRFLTSHSTPNTSSSFDQEIVTLAETMPWIKNVVLDGNELSDLPLAFSSFTRLTSLRLYRNRFTAPPLAIPSLTSLTHLNLCHNALENVSILSSCRYLRSLLLNDNRIAEIPLSFTNLTQLERLYLVRNQISVLPCELSALSLLHDLRINQNRLQFFPASLWHAAIGFELNPYFEPFSVFSQWTSQHGLMYWLNAPWHTFCLVEHPTSLRHKDQPVVKSLDGRALAASAAGTALPPSPIVPEQPMCLLELCARAIMNGKILRLKDVRTGNQPLLPRDLSQLLTGGSKKTCGYCKRFFITPGAYVVLMKPNTERNISAMRRYIPLYFYVCSQRCAKEMGAVYWTQSNVRD